MAAKHRFSTVCFGLLLCLAGCTERIDIKLSSSEPLLVVDARFTSDTTAHIVKLSRTCDYFDPETGNIGITGAEVYITDAYGTRIDFLPSDSIPGWYLSAPDVFGIMGETYHLHVKADLHGNGNLQYYEAQATMPYMPTIDSVQAFYGYHLPPFGHGTALGWNLLLFAQDPPSKEYIGFSYAVNGKVYEDSIDNIFLFPDSFSSGLYLRGVSLFFFPDPTRDNQDQIKVVLHKGDILTLIGYSFTPEYADYMNQVRTSLSTSVPVFSAAPANIQGNISNGALGYFAVYAMGKSSCTVGEKPGERR